MNKLLGHEFIPLIRPDKSELKKAIFSIIVDLGFIGLTDCQWRLNDAGITASRSSIHRRLKELGEDGLIHNENGKWHENIEDGDVGDTREDKAETPQSAVNAINAVFDQQLANYKARVADQRKAYASTIRAKRKSCIEPLTCENIDPHTEARVILNMLRHQADMREVITDHPDWTYHVTDDGRIAFDEQYDVMFAIQYPDFLRKE